MTRNMEKLLEDRVKDIINAMGNKTETWWYIARHYGEAGLDCLIANYEQPKRA